MNISSAYLSKPWTKFYPENVAPCIDISEKSITQLFDEAATQYADQTAIVFYGKKISYKELHESVNRFASGLSSIGVAKGSRVGLYLLNSPQFIIAYFGALKIGAIVVPISPAYTGVEIRHQLTDSGAQIVICQDILFENLKKSGIPIEKVIITAIHEYLPLMKKTFGKSLFRRAYGNSRIHLPKVDESKGIYDFQTLIGKSSPEPPSVEINPRKDLAVLPYTGGTTAEPKGVMLTHYNLVTSVYLIEGSWLLLEKGNEVIVSFLPLYHIYGQIVIMLFGSMVGAKLLLYTTPDTEEILYGMEKHQATIFFGVPSLYEYLKDHEKTDLFDWKKLKLLISGADTLHASTMEGWEKRTGTEIIEGYGMTETSGISHVNPYHRRRKGSFGIPIPNVTAAIINPETHKSVPVNETGEMILSGPNIMQGYWNNEKETRQTLIDIDGTTWLKTGDLCRMDEEGYFYFYDRKKDLIKFKGYSVFAREIEEVLNRHEYIKTAGVIGVPDPKVGNYIKANVVLHPEARGKISEEEIKQHCKENLAHYKVPHIVEFRGELPKTDVGKVSRRELREEHG